jgi:hypothetical protein
VTAISLVLAVTVALLASLLAAVVLMARAAAKPERSTLTAEVAAARRHQAVTSAFATVAFFVSPPLIWIVVAVSGGSHSVAYFPLVGASFAMVVLQTGELSLPRPSGSTRTAVLSDRSVGTVMSGLWSRVYAAVLLVVLLVLAVGTWLADPSGRAIRGSAPIVGAERVEYTAGPFPGFGYAVPQAIAALILTGLLGLLVRTATRRPSVITADRETDIVLRRASVARALRAATLSLLVTLSGDLLVGGSAARRVWDSGWQHNTAVAIVMLGLLVPFAVVATLLAPVPKLATTAPPMPMPKPTGRQA